MAKHSQHIVKRRGHTEPFDSRKIYGSVYSACAAVRMGEKECEVVAEKVSSDVSQVLMKKKKISSHDISKLTNDELSQYNEDAAYMYRTHRDIS